jgi:hypothetical protein
MRSEQLRAVHGRAVLLSQRATLACLTATIICQRAEAVLVRARATRSVSQQIRKPKADRSTPPLPALPSTTVYVWGYGPPDPATTRFGCRYTESAGQYAAQQGWDEEDWAAWAFEIRLLGSWAEVVHQFAPQLQQDPAVSGWAIQYSRSFGQFQQSL